MRMHLPDTPCRALVAILLFAVTLLAPVFSHADMYLGSVAMDVPAAMVQRLTPLTRYLSAKTGEKIHFRASPNLGSAVDDIGVGHTQIAYLTPVAYIEAHQKYNVLPLASPLTHGKTTFNLVIVVRDDSPIRTVSDLRGKRFAFGDEKALLQRAVVVGSGVKLEELGNYAFLNHYDNIAKAVLNGDFDAGILKDTIAEKFKPQGLRYVHVSPDLSSYLFAVNNTVPPAMVTKLRKALLELKPDTAEGKMILGALDSGYDGFSSASDSEYDVIRKLIAPFEK
jgi:phosphonate transport system substrate-binding protein